MSKILLVDTNFSSRPIYNFLKEAGHDVIVIGGNPNDSLAKSSNDYINIDYSDIAKTEELIRIRNIDYIIPGCNDLSYMVCARINKSTRFPGIDSFHTSEIINNKRKFREFALKHNIPSPQIIPPDEVSARSPFIVKPVDSFSGKGVSIILEYNEKEYQIAVKQARAASHTESFLIEEYVEGQLYSHSAFIQDEKIIADFVVEEHSIINKFTVDTSRLSYSFPFNILSNIRRDIEFIANELGLKNGLIHTQFIYNKDKYWLIEITRRCPGDLYSQLIELSTGMKYAENYVRPFLGVHYDIPKELEQNWVMRHTLTQTKSFTLGSIDFKYKFNLSKLIPISRTGDCLHGSPLGRIAVMFAQEEDETSMDRLFQLTLDRELYVINL